MTAKPLFLLRFTVLAFKNALLRLLLGERKFSFSMLRHLQASFSSHRQLLLLHFSLRLEGSTLTSIDTQLVCH